MYWPSGAPCEPAKAAVRPTKKAISRATAPVSRRAAAVITFITIPGPDSSLRPAARRLTGAVALLIAFFVGLTAAFAGSHGAPLGRYTTSGAYKFISEPTLHPPIIKRLKSAPASELSPGYILTTNFFDLNDPPIVGQSGPLILDSSLQPVWFQPVPEKVLAINLAPQTWEGKPALSWWQGKVTNTGRSKRAKTSSSISTTASWPD